MRYLDLSSNGYIKILPKSIYKIHNLQVLNLDWCTQLKELPKKIEKLVNLTHLSCDGCSGLTHMPRGIGKLTSLQTLSMFVVDKDGSHGGADLSELSGLNNLRGGLMIRNLGWVKTAKDKFRAANLKEKQHLQVLVLNWSDDPYDDDKSDDKEKSLEDLQPHPNLKVLRVIGWRSDPKFPSWLSLLTNLIEFTILGPSKFKHLSTFSQLPHLQKLQLFQLTELEYIEDNDTNRRGGESEPFFPSLTFLSIVKCPNMKSWWRNPIDDHVPKFPCLSDLLIKDCPLASMPLYLSLDTDLVLNNVSSRPLKQTIEMSISSSSMAPSSLTSSLSLSKLKGYHLESIKEPDPNMLDNCLQNMTSLELLSIASCHWLKSLSGCLQHLIGLKNLLLRDCTELDLESTQGEPPKNLSTLEIDDIPRLVFLPLWLQYVQLKMLQIKNCRGLRSLFPVFQHLTSLELLEVKDCKELELSAPNMQTFQDNTALRILSLENIPTCQHLPKWLQHLTNLQFLYLGNFPNLTSLPDEMCDLTTLEMLFIQEIPNELEERCRKEIGADWHKIAHIPGVSVTHRRLPEGNYITRTWGIHF